MPEAAIAPAPTPTPAPTPPSPSPTPSTPAPAAPAKPSVNPFSKIDERAKIKPAPVVDDPTKANEPKEPVTETQDEPLGDDIPAPDPKRPETPLVKKLRNLATVKTREAREFAAKISEYEKKMAELEKGGGDSKVLSEAMTAKEKEIEELRKEIGTYRYEKTPEFVEKHEAPYESAAQYAMTLINGLRVDNGDGTNRGADWETDFGRIFSLPPAIAESEAESVFGKSAGAVMRQYEKLHELKSNRDRALKEYRANAGERSKVEQAEQIRKQQDQQQQREKAIEQSTKAFAAITNDLQNESPELYTPDPKDTESEAIFKESLALVDNAYFNRAKLKPEELIQLDAAIRLRAASHPLLVRKNALLNDRIAELEAALDEKGDSTPGKTRLRTKPSANGDKEFFADLKETVGA